MAKARTTKTRTKSSTNNGENLPKRVKNLEIENASMKAEKVGWWRGGVALAATLAFMLSITAGAVGFVYAELKAEIRILDVKVEAARAEQQQIRAEQQEMRTELMEEINQNRQLIIRMDEKLNRLLILNQAGTGANNATTIDTPVNAPVNAPSNTDTPNNPTNPTPILLNPTPQETYHVPL